MENGLRGDDNNWRQVGAGNEAGAGLGKQRIAVTRTRIEEEHLEDNKD